MGISTCRWSPCLAQNDSNQFEIIRKNHGTKKACTMIKMQAFDFSFSLPFPNLE